MSFEEYLKDEQEEKEEMDLRVRSKVEMMLADMKKNETNTILHSHPSCKYKLPCGRCDKTGEMCNDFYFAPIKLEPVVPILNTEGETENVKYSNATDYATDASYTNHT